MSLASSKLPEDETWRDEHLVFAAAVAIRPVRIVNLDLGPEIFGDVILESDIGDDRNADRVFML